MSTTLEVRGYKIRTSTQRRYVVLSVLSDSTEKPLYVQIQKRSDNLETVQTYQRRYNDKSGRAVAVVMDTVTKQEV